VCRSSTPKLAQVTRPLNILLIDDSMTDRYLAQEAFESQDQPCILITAESGPAALALLDTLGTPLPDVILLDINMPEMNGFDVLAALKQHPQSRMIPVVMLTTSVNEDDITRAYTLHASAYLFKSMHFQVFLEQIEKFIGFWTQARLTTRPQMISG
jgi:CheY-like chemotaxis protein